MDATESNMRIGELARRSGVPASTLRYYESEGLLPTQRAGNGYRVYGPEAVDRLAFIAQAKHLDLPLPAVRELAAAWESEPCRSVRARYRPGGGDYAARVQQWRDLLSGTDRTEIDGGVRVTLPTSALERAVTLAAAEQNCCAFYRIRIDLRGPAFDLTITAPPEAAGMLADLLPEEVAR